jgi:hypothetical protein
LSRVGTKNADQIRNEFATTSGAGLHKIVDMACLKLARPGPGEGFRPVYHGNVQTKAIPHDEIARRGELFTCGDQRPASGGPYTVLGTALCPVDGLDTCIARNVANVIKNLGVDLLEQLLRLRIGSAAGCGRDQQQNATLEREAHDNSLFRGCLIGTGENVLDASMRARPSVTYRGWAALRDAIVAGERYAAATWQGGEITG